MRLLRILGRVVRGLLLGALCAVVLINLWQLAARALLGQAFPTVFGYAQVTVLSGSMEPTFSPGDLLLLHRQAEYQPGDILTFWDQGSLTTHRAISSTPQGFVTQGDYNNAPDPDPVPPERVVGRVVGVLPGVGAFLQALRTPAGLLLLLALGLALLFLPGWLKRLSWKRKERDR